MPRRRTRGLVALGMLASACSSQTDTSGPIRTRDSWARAADSGATGAMYLTLENTDTTDIAISGWASPVAVAAELHETMQHDGMVHMTARPAIQIPRDSVLTMAPGGLHVMLIELRHALAVGDTVPVQLTLVDGRVINARVPVRAP